MRDRDENHKSYITVGSLEETPYMPVLTVFPDSSHRSSVLRIY